MDNAQVCGLLLAAGYGRRFGGDKLLHPLPDGSPLVLAALRTMQATLPQVAAVVRKDHAPLRALLAAKGVSLIDAPEADPGLGCSLAAGVRGTAEAAGWIIALADMPLIRPATFAAVLAALQGGASLVVPTHRQQQGHPVGFGRAHFAALATLHGDRGARQLLQTAGESLLKLEVNDPGVLIDVDAPADLAAAMASAR